MHIAIEGMDGVGKTSLAQNLASKLGWEFVEKPFHYLLEFDEDFNIYKILTNKINNEPNENLRALFYSFGNAFVCEKFKSRNIITDRHILSNYSWNGNENNNILFNYLVELCGKPDLTILLCANDEIRERRIRQRNEYDEDLEEIYSYPNAFNKMKLFLDKHSMKYSIVDNSEMTVEESAQLITRKISDIENS